MENFNFNSKFTFEKRHGFIFKITLKGKTNGVHIAVDKWLRNPNYDSWNQKGQCFQEATEDAIYNNRKLEDMRSLCSKVIERFNPTTPQELKRLLLEKGSCVDAYSTVGSYLSDFIEELKNPIAKNPSASYQHQITLLHKLEKEGNIINVPISEFSNEHFVSFGKWILGLSVEEGRNNYLPLMGNLKRLVNKAQEEGLNNNAILYKHGKDAPIKERKEKQALSEKEYKRFKKLDLQKVSLTGPNPQFHKELYYDFCLFIGETSIRPCDLIHLSYDNIKKSTEGVFFVSYVPDKKKNNKSIRVVKCPLSKEALRIVEKYKGFSKGGYVFPFAMNEKRWDMKNPKEWKKWRINENTLMGRINRFLKKVAPQIGFKGNLTAYIFRHTCITNAVGKASDMGDVMNIAQRCGTSLKMVQEHYYHDLDLIDAGGGAVCLFKAV